MQHLTMEHIKQTAHSLAIETMSWDEPIPAFETRFPNVLESCLATPFQKFNKKLLYQGIAGKAAILFYLLIKNHPFQNGNKRIAITSMFIFLYLNNYWLKVDNKILYNVALWISSSPAQAKDESILYLEKFIKKYLTKL